MPSEHLEFDRRIPPAASPRGASNLLQGLPPSESPRAALWGRGAAVLMVAAECLLLAQAGRRWTEPIAFVGLAVLALTPLGRRFAVRLRPVLGVLGLGLASLVRVWLLPATLPDEYRFVRTELAQELARFLLAAQVFTLWHANFRDRLPGMWIGAGAAAAVFLGDVRLHPDAIRAMKPAVVALVGFAVLTGLTTQRTIHPPGLHPGLGLRMLRAGLIAAALLAAAGLSVWGAAAATTHRERFELWLTRLAAGSTSNTMIGFSGQGGLSDIQRWRGQDGDQIALRVGAATPPGYLRGAVFENYQHRYWGPPEHWMSVPGQDAIDRVALRSSERAFRISASALRPDRVLEFWPEAPEHSGAMCLPEGVAVVLVDAEVVISNLHGTALRDPPEGPYRAVMGGGETPLPPDNLLARLTTPPVPRTPAIDELAAELFRDCRTPREKIDAVQQYFPQNFVYQLGGTGWGAADPLDYFLRKRAPAHCEYFATAAVLVLRAGGVPARYVTGYVCHEQSADGGYWIARRRDAHAWAEAYNAVTGKWETVEATPGDGVPQARSTGGGDVWDAVLFRGRRCLEGLTDWAWSGRLASLFADGRGIVLLVLAAAAVGTWLLRREPSARSPRLAAPGFDAPPALTKLRARLDRRLSAVGWRRGASESLEKFADRLVRAGPAEAPSAVTRDRGPSPGSGGAALSPGDPGIPGLLAAANWYRDYSRLRFRESPAVEEHDALVARLPELLSQLSRRASRSRAESRRPGRSLSLSSISSREVEDSAEGSKPQM